MEHSSAKDATLPSCEDLRSGSIASRRTQVLQLNRCYSVYYLMSEVTRYFSEGAMLRSRSVGIAITVVTFPTLVLLLIASSRSTPSGTKSRLAVFPTPTQVSALQPNSNGAMPRANVHGTGVF